VGICTPANASVRLTISIAQAVLADLPAVLAIEGVAFTDPWSVQSFRDALLQPAVYFACARGDGDAIVGYVVAWFAGGEGEITNIAVERARRRAGVGGSLLDAALEEGTRRKALAVFLEVRESNVSARRLYHSRGFEEVGRRPRYYRKPSEDAIVLRCVLALIRR
jgi:[ribosomal protein S18]-alanine N-acetyltransferase